MDFIDYYKVLEIPKTASESDIKKAYRKLARKYHPDLHPNEAAANNRFQQINEANEVLSDPEKRKKYDKFGADWKHADQFEAAEQQRTHRQRGRQQAPDDFSDFFESMFGGSQRGSYQPKYKGQDINATLNVELSEVYTTHKKVVTVNGKEIRFTLYAGIENGQTVKLAGHGGPGANGGPNGDLYITIAIANHPVFKRDGNNLYVNQPIDLYTALLGGHVMVDSLAGTVKLKVPPETQNGAKVRLKGKGFPVYKKENEFGDLLITYQVQLPTNLSEKEIALFEELSKMRNNDNG